VALYGISLLMAKFGGGSLDTIALGFSEMAKAGAFDLTTAAGTLMLLVGFAFKLSAVPFHFWCPDVFEGAAAEVGGFLSVASKAAAMGLTLRFMLTLQAKVGPVSAMPLPLTVGVGLMVVATLTATLGNLAALAQTNLKRMLAYSTIAHAGYMMMAVATLDGNGASAVLFYLVGYVPTNLGAFAAVAAVRNATGGETLDHVRGLMQRDPASGITLSLFLLSLLGLPPLVGFAGKFQVFEAVYSRGVEFARTGQPGLATGFYLLLGVGVVNTVISAGYYLRVLKAAVLDDDVGAPPVGAQPVGHPQGVPLQGAQVVGHPQGVPLQGAQVVGHPTGTPLQAFLLLLAAAVVILGLTWNPLLSLTSKAVEGFGAR
jgi:NADH-quinone oxidoreductase subunit N